MRYELTDHEWTAIRPMLPNKPRGVPRPACISIDLHMRRADDLAPFGRLLAQVFGKGVERTGDRLHRIGFEIPLAKFGIADDLLHVRVDLLDDAGRRARRGVQAERDACLVSRNGLRDGRHVGKLRHPLLTAETE